MVKPQSPANKGIQSFVKKAESADKKETIISDTKVKVVTGNEMKGRVPVNAKNHVPVKPQNGVKPRIVPHLISHGKNRHFIPEHDKEGYEMAHGSKKEEKIFHNKEEVALHQENQKVKIAMVSRMSRKRIFNSQGRR